jgi:hypothetical protein
MTPHDGHAHTPAPTTMDRAAAHAFCAELTETVEALIRVLDEETQLVRAAKLSDAAALGEHKASLARRYGEGHGVLKGWGREIGRHAPVEIDHLRRRHEALESAISTNLAVLATARTVSETLIRGVAAAVSPQSVRPVTYRADARRSDPEGTPAGPLSVNVAL